MTVPASPNPGTANEGLVATGYVLAILLPIVGFFLGFALIIKNRAAHGVTVMVLSVIVAIVLVVVLATSSEPFEITPANEVPQSISNCIDEAQDYEAMMACAE